jgi:Protein of unknown function (DUF2752)
MNASPAQHKIAKDEKGLGSRQSRMLAACALFMLSLVILASAVFSLPNASSNEPYFTICGFKNFTGLPCPGCGLAHSFRALCGGDVATAFGFNLLGPPLFLTFVLLWLRSACVLLNKYEPVMLFDRAQERIHLVRAFLIAFAVFGVARIIYVLINYPELVHTSAMVKLVGRLLN